MPSGKIIGALTDIGSEELGHMEIVASLVHQLTRNLTPAEIIAGGFDKYYIGHGMGIFPASASGEPFSAMAISSKGDAISDLNEDLAAEQKARVTYDNLIRLIDDPDVRDPLKFLRQREVVHYQRFGDALRCAQDNTDCRNFYAYNPSYDAGRPAKAK